MFQILFWTILYIDYVSLYHNIIFNHFTDVCEVGRMLVADIDQMYLTKYILETC